MTAAQLDILNYILNIKQSSQSQNLFQRIQMLPQADTGQLADFIHCLVDDIICQQLLPRMFEPHEKKLGIKLSFRPELQADGNTMHYSITGDVTTDCSTQSLNRSFYYGSVSDYYHLNQLSTEVQQQALVWCTMLGHIVGRAECLRIRLDYNVAKTPFARLYSPLEVLFPVIVEFPKSLDSTLVDLMVNGYDLTSVQPFLEA